MRFIQLAIVCASIGTAAQVPFAGCPSDGQAGPVAPPSGSSVSLRISSDKALRLAYYKSRGLSVLGPRGWHCFEVYGSSGATLWVVPEPLDRTQLFSAENGPRFTGPVIQVRALSGGTSGRDRVAEVIARVFPAHRAFVRGIIEMYYQPGSPFAYGPYPDDQLIYRNQHTVEYTTPANKDGLGTDVGLIRNGTEVRGVAILVLPDYDLVHLRVRLNGDLGVLTPLIVRQVEREVSSSKSGYRSTTRP